MTHRDQPIIIKSLPSTSGDTAAGVQDILHDGTNARGGEAAESLLELMGHCLEEIEAERSARRRAPCTETHHMKPIVCND